MYRKRREIWSCSFRTDKQINRKNRHTYIHADCSTSHAYRGRGNYFPSAVSIGSFTSDALRCGIVRHVASFLTHTAIQRSAALPVWTNLVNDVSSAGAEGRHIGRQRRVWPVDYAGQYPSRRRPAEHAALCRVRRISAAEGRTLRRPKRHHRRVQVREQRESDGPARTAADGLPQWTVDVQLLAGRRRRPGTAQVLGDSQRWKKLHRDRSAFHRL